MKIAQKNSFKSLVISNKAVFISFFLSFFLTFSAIGQLKVATNGKVGIGTTNPVYGSLHIGTDGTSSGISIYQSSAGGSLFSMYRKDDYGYLTRSNSDTRGLRISPTGRMFLYTSETVNYSSTFVTTSNNSLGINYAVMPLSTGVFSFYVQGNGAVFHSGLHTISDSTEKTNIADIESALDKVLRLHGVTYKFKEHNNSGEIKIDDSLQTSSNFEYDENKKISPSILQTLEKEKLRNEMGLIAQEVEGVVPEVVRTTYDGRLTISYQSLVGLLVEAIKEQQSQIDELKAKADVKLKSTEETDFSSRDLTASLSQNKPNPFSKETTIEYYIPSSVIHANLYFYDLQGKQIKNIQVNERGNGSVSIHANELQAGMYKYALIADGQVIGTRTMILTE